MKNNSKQVAHNQNTYVLLGMGFVFAAITYGAASWAIDSGAIPLYFVTFAGTGLTIKNLVRAAKSIIRN